MALTYLEITNLALRDINEVPLSEQLFINSRGLQQFAKEAVNRAFFDISNSSTKWPWLQTQKANLINSEIRKLVLGQQWYEIDSLSTGKLECDWNTFILTEKDLSSTDPLVIASVPQTVKVLKPITYDEWIENYRLTDFSGKKGTPEFVIRYPSGKYGVSPIPDGDYWVEYNVSSTAVRFTSPTQVIPIPEEFTNVLLSRITYYLWLFRENKEQANFSLGEYRESLAMMKRIMLSNKEEKMRAI